MKFKQLTDLDSASGALLDASRNSFFYDIPESRTVPKAGLMGHVDPQGAGLFYFEYLVQNGFYTLPPTGCAVFKNGRVVGTRTFLAEDAVFNDTIYVNPDEKRNHILSLAGAGKDSWVNEDTGLSLRSGDEESFDIDLSGKEIRREQGPIAFIGSHEFSNWGSFLFRVVPKIATLKRMFLDDFSVMGTMHYKNCGLLLNLLGVDRIIPQDRTAIYDVDTLIVPSLPSPHTFYPPEVVAFYNQLSRTVTNRKPFRKIYVSRLSEAARNYRKMVNEAEFIQRLTALGFEIVTPASLPIREQIRVFAEAKVVVGPSGAGMFNVVFCQPGTLVFDIESARDWIYAHTNMFSSLGHHFAIIEGLSDKDDPRPTHKNWHVDVDAVTAYIQSHI